MSAPWSAAVHADLLPVLEPGGAMDTALTALPASTNLPRILQWVSTAATDRKELLLGIAPGGTPTHATIDGYIQRVVVPELDAFVAAGFDSVMLTFGSAFVDDQPLYGTFVGVPLFAFYQYFIMQVTSEVRQRNLYFALETGAGGVVYDASVPTTQCVFDSIERGAHWLDANCHPDIISNQAEPSSIKTLVMRQIKGVNTPGDANYVDAARLGVYWQHWGATRPATGPTMYEAHSLYCGGCMPSDGIAYMQAVCAASATNNGGKGIDGCDTHLFPFVNGCAPAASQPWQEFIRYGQMAAAAGLVFTSTTGVLWPISAAELCSNATPHPVSQYAGYGRGCCDDTRDLWQFWSDRVQQAGVALHMRTVQLGYWSARMAFADLVPAPAVDYALTDTANWQAFGQILDKAANAVITAGQATLAPFGQHIKAYVKAATPAPVPPPPPVPIPVPPVPPVPVPVPPLPPAPVPVPVPLPVPSPTVVPQGPAMSQLLSDFVHPVFTDHVQVLLDGSQARWLLTLSKDGHGAQIYRQHPTSGPLELVVDNGTFAMGQLFIGIDGKLHHIGGNQDGTFTISDPIPGFVPLTTNG